MSVSLAVSAILLTSGCSESNPAGPSTLVSGGDVQNLRPAAAISTTPGLFVSRQSAALCLDVFGASAKSGTPVVLWTCHGGANQTFTMQATGEIRTGALCLDAVGVTSANGAAVAVSTCTGGASQQWTTTAAGEVKGINGRCVDIERAGTTNGTAILLWDCHGGANQAWDRRSSSQPLQVATMVLTPNVASVAAASTTQLVATVRDAAGLVLTGRTIAWKTSSAAATVSVSGLVRGVTAGPVTITATSEGVSQSAAVTVTVAAPPPLTGIPINPGESMQAKVDANPAGTQFVIKAGIHRRQSVVPKAGMKFIGERGAVLDGEGVTAYAFQPGAALPANVVIRALTIRRYAPPAQMAAVRAGGHGASEATRGWVIDSNRITGNGNIGVRIGHTTRVTRNVVDSNGTLGIGGVGDSAVVEGNEIAYNNASGANPDFEAGGTKFVKTRWLLVRGNFVHHNRGPGLWSDIDNTGTIYENNRVEDNGREGIVIEISGSTVIRGNTVRRNGIGDRPGWLWGAGIAVHASKDVTITGNTVENNQHGIVGIQQPRGTANGDPGSLSVYELRNVLVADNVIVQPTGASGVVQDAGDATVFAAARNLRWERNRYTLGTNAAPFAWMNSWRNDAAWRGYGLDVAGVFVR